MDLDKGDQETVTINNQNIL